MRSEKEIKEWLKEYEAPPLSSGEMEELIKKINGPAAYYYRMTLLKFIKSQFVFIRKRTWLCQFIAVILCCLYVGFYIRQKITAFDIYPFLTAIAPVLMIIGMDEISRVYNGSLCELQQTTKYPLKVILLVRMSFMVSVDILLLFVCGIYLKNLCQREIVSTMLYILVPFEVSCIGILIIMRYVSGNILNYICFVYCLIIGGIPFLYNIYSQTAAFDENNIFIWKIACLAGIVIMGIEFNNLVRQWRLKGVLIHNEIGT